MKMKNFKELLTIPRDQLTTLKREKLLEPMLREDQENYEIEVSRVSKLPIGAYRWSPENLKKVSLLGLTQLRIDQLRVITIRAVCKYRKINLHGSQHKITIFQYMIEGAKKLVAEEDNFEKDNVAEKMTNVSRIFAEGRKVLNKNLQKRFMSSLKIRAYIYHSTEVEKRLLKDVIYYKGKQLFVGKELLEMLIEFLIPKLENKNKHLLTFDEDSMKTFIRNMNHRNRFCFEAKVALNTRRIKVFRRYEEKLQLKEAELLDNEGFDESPGLLF